ncbi:MarR family winged helix-turn-helix transcriptional regulator [Streptomyces sp. NBC_01387]|uniref:MarR family winged helix-turn-helix transcriptional regulator n=1 Tax=unclassified Streptomyces TaxID=2593676 RepID=UPI002024AC31|nr:MULTISPECIES: MarR family winged helix-turn-helix transcriptional regulator [unclassified Streptomyces]MCX4553306.1 MarR family winged helix-turn-helix transcriptional regulator [Streptomyces sp. NBC_01500]WSC18271.1 MarR family winged helix-turn-helix transcriptional regulator [Streptomyces sp. NBC_01766]WSV52313.1 MarR family winged helix-turn-helix transcriptional regulator [Streptomyces sp. NBC_01014]
MSQERADSEAGVLTAAIAGLGPLARQLNQAHTRLWYEQVHQDLTGPQFTVLSLLRTRGDMDQGTLAALAHLDKSTAAPLLDRLRRRGLVEIGRDESDRRRKLVRITGTGRELAVRLAPAVAEVNEQLLAPFTAEERDQFLSLLRRAVQRSER